MYVDLLHWNNNSAVFIHFFTTGPVPGYHEITELTIFPVDGNFELLDDIVPFTIKIEPKYPERSKKYKISDEEIDIFHPDFGIRKYCGESYEVAVDILNYWLSKFPFRKSKTGELEKKMMPFLYDGSKLPFLMYFFGITGYEALFQPRHRDLLATANFMNDVAATWIKPTVFYKTNPITLASRVGVKPEIKPSNTLDFCILFAKIYKNMCGRPLY